MLLHKILKKWGDSIVLVLSSEEREILGVVEGDVVDIEIGKSKQKG